jgi:hypothetical protein
MDSACGAIRVSPPGTDTVFFEDCSGWRWKLEPCRAQVGYCGKNAAFSQLPVDSQPKYVLVGLKISV